MNRIAAAIILLAGVTLAFSFRLAGTRDEAAVATGAAQPAAEAVPAAAAWSDDELLAEAGLLNEDEALAEEAFTEPPDSDRLPRRRRTMPLARAWETLVPLAEDGDAGAAYRLFRVLDTCRRALGHGDDGAAFMRNFERRLADALPERRERMEATIRRLRDNCEGGTPEQLETALDWLTQAAEFGHTSAQLVWAMRARGYLDLADESTRAWYERKSGQYLAEARDAGSLQAMQMIARRDADPVNAWAHMSLALRVSDERMRTAAASERGIDPRRAEWTQHRQVRLQTMMNAFAGRMSNAQISTAQQRADELYENCCR